MPAKLERMVAHLKASNFKPKAGRTKEQAAFAIATAALAKHKLREFRKSKKRHGRR